ncbi:4Fe-4S dicluster domain-containing protein [Spartinivicinus ruber]|uniref:4Fe-4S dicluster domain-containing protein n=1 Tax=Spartinivicinus ruber TaxID=2683272 RepID=UPI0013D54F5C|nr:4Fe-4S dicluster domain-containing protein [Spartinivicinus ruber]
MTKFVRLIDMDRCMGCQACVAACYQENHYTPGSPWNEMIEYEIGTYPHVGKVFGTMGCMHCEGAPCKTVCDAINVHAISKNEYGVVLVDYDKCIGCGYCDTVCPYNVPQFSKEITSLYGEGELSPLETIPQEQRHPTHRKKNNVMEKCTFCWHKLEQAINSNQIDKIGVDPHFTPSCDLVCPVDARFFGDLDNPDSEVSRQIGTKKATQLKKEYGTNPQVYYKISGGDF